jgi:predicted nuclease with RNAse H fold
VARGGGRYVGVDVGASAFHGVSIDGSGHVLTGAVFATDEVAELVEWAAGARVIAIDAPDRPSQGAHATDLAVAPKFRAGRCAEVALGLQHRYWVPWITPAEPPPGSWISAGIALHQTLRAQTRAEVIEVFPYAGFRQLAGDQRLAKKTTLAGSRTRTWLLRSAGLNEERLELWSHDSLDAAMAALIAADRGRDAAVRVECDTTAGCKRDGSVIWLPDPRRPRR